jgi:hypothetical protein
MKVAGDATSDAVVEPPWLPPTTHVTPPRGPSTAAARRQGKHGETPVVGSTAHGNVDAGSGSPDGDAAEAIRDALFVIDALERKVHLLEVANGALIGELARTAEEAERRVTEATLHCERVLLEMMAVAKGTTAAVRPQELVHVSRRRSLSRLTDNTSAAAADCECVLVQRSGSPNLVAAETLADGWDSDEILHGRDADANLERRARNKHVRST